jgi:hypothetical protein
MKSVFYIRSLFIILAGSAILIGGCGLHTPDWTQEEKENIAHFFNSREADQRAVRLSNSGEPFTTFTQEEWAEFVRLKKLALAESKLIRDEVLAKANSELPKRYRQLYQRSLELQIQNMEVGDINAEIEGASLHDSWVDWINANKHSIKIPK